MFDSPPRPEQIAEFERSLLKDVIRFVAARPDGRHSAVWYGRRTKNDYYIGARSVSGSIKVSLHDGQYCQLALTSEYHKRLAEKGLAPTDRRFVHWSRAKSPEAGATCVVQLVFPLRHLRLDAPTVKPGKPIVAFGSADPEKAVEVGFFFSREPAATLEPQLLAVGAPIIRTELADGDSVSVVVREASFEPHSLPPAERLAAASTHVLEPDAFPAPGETADGLTAMFWNEPKDGETLRLTETGGVAVTRAG